MSDQCPTCGSHDPLYELVPVKARTARIAVVPWCPDTWHFATDATAPNVEHKPG